jgi:hypothetical protein
MALIAFGFLFLVLCIGSCHAKEGDRQNFHNQQPTKQRKYNPTNDDEHLYQYNGSLCVEEECLEPYNLYYVLAEQFRLSQLPHNCRNLQSNCQVRADQGDCIDATYMEYMHSYCPLACQTCHNRTRTAADTNRESTRVIKTKHGGARQVPQRNLTALGKKTSIYKVYSQASREDNRKRDAASSQKAEPRRPPHPLLNVTTLPIGSDDDDIIDAYGSDLGVPQLLYHGALRNVILSRIQTAQRYYRKVIVVDTRYRMVREKCRHANPYCAAWAALGHCDSDDYCEYMTAHCGPVCETCTELHVESKSPIDNNVRHGV